MYKQEFSFLKNLFLFIYLALPRLSYSVGTLSCGMWDLVPWPGIEWGSVLEAQSLNSWTSREVLRGIFLFLRLETRILRLEF